MTTLATTTRTCAGPGCAEPLEGRPPSAKFCSDRCRKAAYRERVRAERPAPEPRKTATRSTRVPRRDPEQVEASAAAFKAALERETTISLARDPSRWRWISSAAPDEHRRKPRREPWRAAP